MDKRTRRRFDREEQAKTYAIGQEAIARDNGPQNTGKGLTWGQWRERWMQLRRVEPSTKQSDDGRIRNHLAPKWDRRLIRSITRNDIQAWVNELDDDPVLSASTVRRIYYLMSASMKAAVKAGMLPANPCTLIDLPTPARGKERYLSKPEFWLVRSNMNAVPYGDAAVMLAYTGMRFGELAGLHWSRVDLERNLIHVVETWDAVDRKIKAYPKGKEPRSVPIAPEVAEVLASLDPGSGKCGHPHTKGSVCSSRLVLTSPTGLPLDYSTMREQHLIPAVEAAGLPPARLHDLRHTFASWLAQDGVPLQVIQKLLGHGSVTVTERYSHIGAEQYERVLTALSGGREVQTSRTRE